MDLGLLVVELVATGGVVGGQAEYMLCTFCLLFFTSVTACLCTRLAAGIFMLMNGFSCSIGGDGALQVFDGPEADLDLLPCGAIKLKTAPLLPPTKLDLLPEKRPKDST